VFVGLFIYRISTPAKGSFDDSSGRAFQSDEGDGMV